MGVFSGFHAHFFPRLKHCPTRTHQVWDRLYVSAFNNRNAAAIAALFTPLGKIVGSDRETLSGRQAIEDYYRELFTGEEVPRIALEASDVQLVAPGVAIEEGQVHLTLADDEPVQSIGYTVTHARQTDGSWLMDESRSLPEVPKLSDWIKPLHWMTGEWTLESDDGLRIDMVIDLDDRENYLLGEALVTDVTHEAQTINLRIGWNPATSSVYWWVFDSEGGNSCGPWARRGDEWVVSTTGITADAEAQRFIPDPHSRWRYDGVERDPMHARRRSWAGPHLSIRAPCAGSVFLAQFRGRRGTGRGNRGTG